MPCIDSGPSYTDTQRRLSKVLYLLDEVRSSKAVDIYDYEHNIHPQTENSKQVLDEKTDELCSIINNYYGKGDGDIREASLELRMWWRNHEIDDNKRVEKEKQDYMRNQHRKSGLAKLTKEERKALGL